MRLARGWTQEQLAEKLDIDSKHMSRIELGYYLPTFMLTQKLARVLDFDLRTFDEIPIEELPKVDKATQRALRLFSSTKDEELKEYYLDFLHILQKGFELDLPENNEKKNESN